MQRLQRPECDTLQQLLGWQQRHMRISIAVTAVPHLVKMTWYSSVLALKCASTSALAAATACVARVLLGLLLWGLPRPVVVSS